MMSENVLRTMRQKRNKFRKRKNGVSPVREREMWGRRFLARLALRVMSIATERNISPIGFQIAGDRVVFKIVFLLAPLGLSASYQVDVILSLMICH